MEEEWRDVVGYESLYMISNLGRIKSLLYIAIYRSLTPTSTGSKTISLPWPGRGFE